MSEGHSRFGGSIASRWMNCPGSVALCATVPALPESSYAQEGTRAHALGQYCLVNGLRSTRDVDADMFAAPTDMLDAVQVYLDAVYEELSGSKSAELYVEQKFAFPTIGDGTEVYGANDALVYHPSSGRVVVFDYKHGVGVSVSAEDNAQLKFYAAGAVFSNPTWRISEVVLVVVQPRARDVEDVGAVKPWPLDVVDILNFTEEVERGVALAKRAEIEGPQYTVEEVWKFLNAGSWCRWCDAAAICSAREKATLDALTLPYADLTDMHPDRLPPVDFLAGDKTPAGPERIAQIIKGIDTLNTWANQVREFAEAHMIAGNMEIPGWKVVEKIGRRKWVAAENDIAGYIGVVMGVDFDEIMPRKLVTITEAEKLMKAAGATKEEREEVSLKFTIKESSGHTIAPASDRREAVNAVAQHFDGVKV